MFKFGNLPIRSLESFGVSGLLGESCRVYYDSLFSSRSHGRFSDLISAILRAQGTDELRVRALLLYTFFAAYRAQASATDGFRESPIHLPLPEPLVLEFGFDEEKLALSFSFVPGSFLSAAGVPQGALAETLARLRPYADRVVVRVEAGKRVELVALLGIPGKIALENGADRPEATMVQVPPGAQAPEPAEYIQLGDVDYMRLLAGVEPGQKFERPSAGEIMAQGSNELADAIRSRKRVSGALAAAPEDVVIKGDRSDLLDQTAIRIEGGEAPVVDEAAHSSEALIRPYIERIEQLQAELEEARAATGAVAETKGAIGGLLKKVWPFSKATEEIASEENVTEAAATVVEAPPEQDPKEEKPIAKPRSKAKPEPEPVSTGGEVETSALVEEIEEGGLNRTIKHAQEEVGEIKKDIQSARAKRWVDGLMSDLVKERSRIKDLAKKLSSTVRQKEQEFKVREFALQEELKRRDESIKQKESALGRLKEQNSQLTLKMEKLKGSGEKSEDAGTKSKLNLTQKLLAASKDEVHKLNQKIDDLKDQLATAQIASTKKATSTTTVTELTAMKMKYERAVRHSEELRTMNDQLTDRLQTLTERMDGKKESEAAPSEAAKKLEGAVKQLGTAHKENEQLKLRIEEMQREEARLKNELKRAQADMKSLKIAAIAQRKSGGSSSEGGSSAA